MLEAKSMIHRVVHSGVSLCVRHLSHNSSGVVFFSEKNADNVHWSTLNIGLCRKRLNVYEENR